MSKYGYYLMSIYTEPARGFSSGRDGQNGQTKANVKPAGFRAQDI